MRIWQRDSELTDLSAIWTEATNACSDHLRIGDLNTPDDSPRVGAKQRASV